MRGRARKASSEAMRELRGGAEGGVVRNAVRKVVRNAVIGAIALVVVTLSLSGCAGQPTATATSTAPAAPAALQVGQENVITVASGTIVVGPMLSGELRPAREATIRAELGGAMLAVSVDEGQAVGRGAPLGRIETRTLDDVRQSATSALRSAESQLAVAKREAERTEQLVTAGALAARDLDVARSNITAVEAQVADARSRLASAERQLGDAVLNSPIAGIVSSRSVNVGDIVAVGTPLFTVIDPSSMRLEASVPSDDLSQLRVGASVQFQVRGYDQPFIGRIERIAPQADPTTRQVPLYIAIPNVGGRLVAGLFAEGRVVSTSATGLVVPVNAVNTSGAESWALRVTNGTTERVMVTLGLRDPRTERVQVSSGLSEGDHVLRGAAQGIPPGTLVQIAGVR